MRVRIQVHPGAWVPRIEQREELVHVWVKAPPVDGKANASAVHALAELHGVARSAVRLVSGASGRSKIFEIEGV